MILSSRRMSPPLKSWRVWIFFFLFLPSIALAASNTIHYRLTMPQPSSHLFVVSIEVDEITAPYVDFQMPAWSPGRYIIYDFAHNVQEFRVRGNQDAPWEFGKIDKQTWRVHTSGHRRVTIEYKVFANTLSGTFSQLNDEHANYNGASIYMYVVGMKDRPIDLTIEAPKGWTVLNGLKDVKFDGNVWTMRAENYDILIDCPTEIALFTEQGPIRLKSFSHAGKNFRVLIHNNGSDKNLDRFVTDLEKIVKAEITIMGVPDFDTYTFLFHFNPYAKHGDGMEHLNSTQIVNTGNLGREDRYEGYLAVSAHEFFHLWNVKRLRPAALGPWDYTKENQTPSLWISEGLTNYYASLTLRRSGLWNDAQYFRQMTRTIDAVQNSFGRFERSVQQASFDTWFWHDTPDASNWPNTFLSYYTQGEILGALLDLEIRRRTENRKSLDDVFRTLYKDFYEAPQATNSLRGRGFTESDFREAVNRVSGGDFAEFWKRHVEGREELDYNSYLKAAGFYLDAKPAPATGYAGITTRENGDHLAVVQNVIPESPAAQFGLSVDDVLLALDGVRIVPQDFPQMLKEKKPGQAVVVTVFRENRLLNVRLVLGSFEEVTYSIKELEPLTELQKKIRVGWLGNAPRAVEEGKK